MLYLFTHASLLHHEDYYCGTRHIHGIKFTPARCAEPWFGYSPNAECVGDEYLGHLDQAGPSYQGQ